MQALQEFSFPAIADTSNLGKIHISLAPFPGATPIRSDGSRIAGRRRLRKGPVLYDSTGRKTRFGARVGSKAGEAHARKHNP